MGSVKNLWELNVNSVLLHEFHVVFFLGRKGIFRGYIYQIKHMQNEINFLDIVKRGRISHQLYNVHFKLH